MATADEIANVAELLPSEAADAGWNDAKINAMLDAGNSLNQILLRFWEVKAAESAKLISISESGSSRDLAAIHRQALSMAQYWADKIKSETAIEDAAARRGRARIHIATRV